MGEGGERRLCRTCMLHWEAATHTPGFLAGTDKSLKTAQVEREAEALTASSTRAEGTSADHGLTWASWVTQLQLSSGVITTLIEANSAKVMGSVDST